jgi:hypothetical protein
MTLDEQHDYDASVRARSELEDAKSQTEVPLWEAKARRHDELVRAALTKHWDELLFTEREATAIASAYQWTVSQETLTKSVRRKGPETTAFDIVAALRGHDYLSANQLLVAYMLARQRQDRRFR